MKTLLVLATLGLVCSAVSALDCKACSHLVMEGDTNGAKATVLGMWDAKCKAPATDVTEETCEANVTTTYKQVCYSLAVRTNYNSTGDDTNLFMRGCVNVTAATGAGTWADDAKLAEYKDALLGDNSADFSAFKGTMKVCLGQDGCNSDKLKDVSASGLMRASTALVAAMATLLAIRW